MIYSIKIRSIKTDVRKSGKVLFFCSLLDFGSGYFNMDAAAKNPPVINVIAVQSFVIVVSEFHAYIP